jgi:hypothetical protein
MTSYFVSGNSAKIQTEYFTNTVVERKNYVAGCVVLSAVTVEGSIF